MNNHSDSQYPQKLKKNIPKKSSEKILESKTKNNKDGMQYIIILS